MLNSGASAMKNSIFRFLITAVLVLLLVQVAGADYPWDDDPSLGVYTDNESDIIGLDEMSDDQLRDMIQNRINWTENNPDYVFTKSEPADDVPLLRGSATPSSSSWTQENLTYSVNSTHCIITAYRGDATDLIVPNTTMIDGISYNTVLKNNVFGNNKNLTSVSVESGTLYSGGALFTGCSNLKTVNLSGLNWSLTTNTMNLFASCSNLTDLNITGIDTSNCTSLYNMFYNCKSLTNVDVSTFNTSKATSFESMFSGCSNLTQLDVSGFDTSNATTLNSTFSGCSNITQLNVSGFNTSKTKFLGSTFSSCSKLQTLDVSGFNTSNVTNMSSMFSGCSNLTQLNVSGFDTSNVTTMASMFLGCSKLQTLDVSRFNTSKVTATTSMFSGCSNLTQLNVSGFDTSNVTNMAYMFQNLTNISILDVSGFNTSKVKQINDMFSNCTNLTQIDVSAFNTSQVTNMKGVFNNNTQLSQINLSSFNTSNVTNFNYMFNNTGLTDIDVSMFNTSKATSMFMMFAYSSNIKDLNLSNFDTTNLSRSSTQSYQKMAVYMTSLETLDISSFNLSGATRSDWIANNSKLLFIKTPQNVPDNLLNVTQRNWVQKNDTIDTTSITRIMINNGTMTACFRAMINTPPGAVITPSSSWVDVAWNSSVPISVDVLPGYVFNSWNVTRIDNGSQIPVIIDSSSESTIAGHFIMPDSNVSVNVSLDHPQFSVTVVQPAAGATISASSSTAYYNDTITLSSNVQTGYVFNSWNVTDENGTTVTVTGNTFQMPMANVTVTANIDHPLYTITVIQPSEGGTISASALSAYYNDTVNLTYVLDPGYKFSRWNITDEYGNNVSTVSIDGGFFRMPAGNVTVTTTFNHFLISVSVVQPTGATISASPTSGYYGDIVTLSAAVQPGYSFNSWNVTTEGGDTVPVTGNMFTILPETLTWRDYITVRANIEHVQYSLTVIPTTGITVTAPATAYYLNAVTLNKTVSTGYRFLGWNVTTAGGQSVSVSGDSFTMPPDNVSIQALGEKIVYNITELQPEGGSVLANRSNATYGDQVSLTSVPSIGYRFTSWNVTADGVPVTVTGNTFSMPAANVTVSAVYEKIVYNVNITTNTAGTITTNRSTATYGDLVSVSASPVIGYNFESWNVTTDGGQQVSVTNDSFVMPAANVSVAAVFSSATYTVTVAQTTGGNTTVSQSAANPGTVIWITAEPDSGYIITNYAVISEGGDSIFVENSAFAMPASNVTASVTYSVIQPQFTTTPGISFTPTNIVLNYTSNARSNDYPEFIWEVSADNFTTIDNSGTVSGINGSIAFSSNRTSGNLTIRMRPVVGTEWTSITISLSTEVIINIVDGVDGTLISTGTRFTSVGGLVTPSAAVVNAVLNNSTMMITTSGGNTTRMRTWSTTINASAGENLTFTYTGGLDSPWANVTYVVTIPSTNMLNITLPRQESGYAGTVVYYTDGGQPVAGIPVAVYDSSYNDLGTITTYAGGQAVYQTDDFAAVYFDVNTSGYTTNTKVVPIPSHDSVYLSKTRTITIRVMDATGGQFVPAFTTYLGDQEVMKSTDNGSVVYSNVEDGTYSVIVSASGFYQVTREITVDEQNTDFVLNITQQNSTTFTSQNFVRLIYTDIFGNKMPGLTIKITENNTEVFTGITGADGSVSMIMNQTRLYQITATNSQGTVVNTLSLWPQYSEYAIIVKSSANEAPPIETAQLDIYWKTDLVSINASTSRLNLSMKNANENQNVTFTATLKNNTTALNFTSGIIEYGTTTTVNFTVPNANETYLLEVTYTDENGNSRTVTTTIQTNLNEMKMKYEIPGFSEQWHYDALCVLLILVTSFLFSQQTKHIGGIIIPLEAAGLYAIGWLRYSGFAICMLVAVVIMALILFVERMDRD